MRRVGGFVCIFLGALMLMVGVLAKPLVYANLAKVPLDQKSVSVSLGDHMSALQASAAGVKVLTDATLQSTRTVTGIPGKAKGDSVFWQTAVQSTAVGVGDLSYLVEGVSFDRVTGQATNCCGDFKSSGTLEDPSATNVVKHQGLFFKFPFDTQKATYQWWDGDLGRAEPMKFLRTAQIEGVQTYVFQQKSGPETYAKRTGLPGDLFKTDKPVDADAVYENTRTLYIEPNTGIVIKGVEELNKRLEAPGFEAVPITKGTIAYKPETVKKNAEEWGSKGQLLGFVHGPLTPIGVVLGLMLLSAGAFLLLRGSKREPATAVSQGASNRSLVSQT